MGFFGEEAAVDVSDVTDQPDSAVLDTGRIQHDRHLEYMMSPDRTKYLGAIRASVGYLVWTEHG